MSAEKKEEDKEAAAGARRKRLQLIGGAVVLLLLGTGAGVGGAMLLGGGSSAEASEGGHGEAAGGHGEEAGGHGAPAEGGHGAPAEGGHGAPAGGHGEPAAAEGPPVHDGRTVVSLGLFTVNLRGSGGGRVLRTEIQVEVEADEYLVVQTRKPVLRDAVITLASDFSYTDLEGLDGKTHMRDELHGRLNAILAGHPKVEHVYFTEFVVQ